MLSSGYILCVASIKLLCLASNVLANEIGESIDA